MGGAALAAELKQGQAPKGYTNGGQFVEDAPFTAEGKKRFDANFPSYGQRMKAPYLGNNDPQATCDPLGPSLQKTDDLEPKWDGYSVGHWDENTFMDREGGKDWDQQIYCVPSEEYKFNKLIRDGGVGKGGK